MEANGDMKMIKWINHTLIAENGGYVHWTDYAWFYGFYAFITLVTTSTLFAVR